MRNPELTRELIISKAMPLFNRKGYAATSISDITKATGITKGAIYGNFENKDALSVAAFDHASQIIMEELRTSIRSAHTAPLKLKAICTYFKEYIANPPISGGCPFINTSIEADDNHPLLRARVIRSIALIKDSVRKIVNRGIREGQVLPKVDIDEFAHSFYATITGAIMISRVEGDQRTYTLVMEGLLRKIESISS